MAVKQQGSIDTSILFSPFKIAGVELPNRIALAGKAHHHCVVIKADANRVLSVKIHSSKENKQ